MVTPTALADATRRVDPTRWLSAGVQLLARMGVIGLAAFVIDVVVFNLARQLADLGPLTSKTVSVAVATTFAFAANRAWSFGGRAHRHGTGTQYALFILANLGGLGIGLACLGVSTYLLGFTSVLAENLSANGVGLVLGTAFRFWAYHRWVFADEPDGNPHAATGVDRG